MNPIPELKPAALIKKRIRLPRSDRRWGTGSRRSRYGSPVARSTL
jgi:hypothetical protein